jgi:hypothetical protein
LLIHSQRQSANAPDAAKAPSNPAFCAKDWRIEGGLVFIGHLKQDIEISKMQNCNGLVMSQSSKFFPGHWQKPARISKHNKQCCSHRKSIKTFPIQNNS